MVRVDGMGVVPERENIELVSTGMMIDRDIFSVAVSDEQISCLKFAKRNSKG